jgi:hypothetical protein
MMKSMVVTPQPEATEAGRDILAAGGNAIDAAIATALVQSVVDPFMCGIAGFGSLAVFLLLGRAGFDRLSRFLAVGVPMGIRATAGHPLLPAL